MTRHAPRAVAASSSRPSGDVEIVKSIFAPRPPRWYVAGVMPNAEPARSYKRLLDPYPASYIAGVTRSPLRSADLTWPRRHASANARGEMPTNFVNVR